MTDNAEYTLEANWCGEECNCQYLSIYQGDTKLWESFWVSFEDMLYQPELLPKLREQVMKACSDYGLDVDVSSDSIWDWELKPKEKEEV